MGTTGALRRLDHRFVRRHDVDKRASRAARWLPWVLAVTLLAHAVGVYADLDFFQGFVFGGLFTALVAAVQIRRDSARR